MKKRSTTPVLKSLALRGSIVVAAVLMAAAVPMAFFGDSAAARDYEAEIRAAQRQIDQYNAEAAKLSKKADTLQNKVAQFRREISVLQAKIDLKQSEHDKLVADIKANEKKIAENQDRLGKVMADMYVDDDISPLELLIISENIADYIDRQAQRTSIRDSISQTIDDIKDLKAELEEQEVAVKRVLLDQKNQRRALAAKQAEQQQLLDDTKGRQAAYEKLSREQLEKQKKLRELQQKEIAARFANANGSLISGGAAPSYPWSDSNCSMVSPYPGAPAYYSTGGSNGVGGDGYGYGCRQCASYVAWRMARETGYYPANWGDAKDFPANARAAGYSTGRTPRVGALAVMYPGTAGNNEGHIGYVEDIKGGELVISQYNYNYGAGYGLYSKMSMSPSAWDEYIYIK